MTLGNIALLGSGETSLAGGRIFEMLAQNLPRPLRVAVMETPAGFELNSNQVAGRVADFLKTRLQNYQPQIDIVPARKKNSAYDPNDPEICAPLLRANLIFMGAGSPTYAIRNLQNTLAWNIIRARQRMGAALVFASAATIAVSAHALPVYEIYKVGMDVHHVDGLNLFSDFNVSLSFVPHWNNTDGGSDVDTSRCFIGMERFGHWHKDLPAHNTTIGLDEHSGIVINFEKQECLVSGVSSVSLVRTADPKIYPSGSKIPLGEIANFEIPSTLSSGISPEAWSAVQSALEPASVVDNAPPAEVTALAEQRQAARAAKDWSAADTLRKQINALGWNVKDVPNGFVLEKV